MPTPTNAPFLSLLLSHISSHPLSLSARSFQDAYLTNLVRTHKFPYYSPTYGHTVHDAKSLRHVLANVMRHHRRDGLEVGAGKRAVDLLFEKGGEVLEEGFVREVMETGTEGLVDGSEESGNEEEDESEGESEGEMVELERIRELTDSEDEEYVPRVRRAKAKAVREMGRGMGLDGSASGSDGDQSESMSGSVSETDSEVESVREWKSVARTKAAVKSERAKMREESSEDELDGRDENERGHRSEHDSDRDADGEEEEENIEVGYNSASSSDRSIVVKHRQTTGTQERELSSPHLSGTTQQAIHSARVSSATSNDVHADGQDDDEGGHDSESSSGSNIVVKERQITGLTKKELSSPRLSGTSKQAAQSARFSVASSNADADGEEDDKVHSGSASSSSSSVVVERRSPVPDQKASLSPLRKRGAARGTALSARSSIVSSGDMDADGEADDARGNQSASCLSSNEIVKQDRLTANQKQSVSRPILGVQSPGGLSPACASSASSSSCSSPSSAIIVDKNRLTSSTSITKQKRPPTLPPASRRASQQKQKRKSNMSLQSSDSDCIVVHSATKRQKLNTASSPEPEHTKPSTSASGTKDLASGVKLDNGSDRVHAPVPEPKQTPSLHTNNRKATVSSQQQLDTSHEGELKPVKRDSDAASKAVEKKHKGPCIHCGQHKSRSEDMTRAFERLNGRIQEAIVQLWEEIL